MKRDLSKIIIVLLLGLGVLSWGGTKALAQSQTQAPIIQLSGIVIGEDSTAGVPGVHIYVPKAGRGTTSNYYGYFSLPVLGGDSVVISAIGYKKQHYIVPRNRGVSITAVIELLTDTTYLPTVEIFPFPTEEMFKEAILAMKLPDEYDNMNKNLDQDLLAQMFRQMPMDASMNHRYFMDQQFNQMHNKNGPPVNNLLNPFAWAEFIKSIKRGDFKKK